MKVSVDIPENINEITLGQYQEWLLVEGTDEVRAIKMVEIFCGIPFGNLIKMQYADILSIVQHLTMVLSEKPSLTQRFKVNGIEYGLIPNFDEMTFGEFTDLDDHLSDWKTMHQAVYILYRPIQHKMGKYYSIVEYDGKLKNALTMRDVPLGVVFGVVGFILRLGMESSRSILTSIENELKDPTSQQGQHSLNATDGLTSTTHSLKEMQLALSQLVDLTYTSALLTAHTKPVKTK